MNVSIYFQNQKQSNSKGQGKTQRQTQLKETTETATTSLLPRNTATSSDTVHGQLNSCPASQVTLASATQEPQCSEVHEEEHCCAMTKNGVYIQKGILYRINTSIIFVLV